MIIMKRGILFLLVLSFLMIQISFVNSGEINVWGCVGTPSSCVPVLFKNPPCVCSTTDLGIPTSCTLTGFTAQNYCNLEGDYYVKANSTCDLSIDSSPTNVTAFNINWDTDISDCSCKIGNAGNWSLFGNYTKNCCGDDAGETYISNSSSKNKNNTAAFCCATSSDYVIGTSCCNLTSSMVPERSRSCDGTSACCSNPAYYSRIKGTCVPICNEINKTYWEDNSHKTISKVGVGATINITAETVSPYFGSGGINFTIYDEQNEIVESFVNVLQTSNNKTLSWEIPEMGYYYFTAISSDNLTNFSTSGVLDANDSSFNLPSFANIYSPIQEKFYQVNQSLSFSANGSYDQDDLITSISWNLDDEKTSSQWEFQESYSSRGQKEIMLTVGGGEVSEGRYLESKDFKSIIICDGPGTYIFANISSPFYGETIDTRNWSFKSDGSYVKTCSNADCSVCTTGTLDSFSWNLYKFYDDGGYTQIMAGNGSTWEVSNLGGSIANYKLELTVEKSGVEQTTQREFLVRYLDDSSNLVCVVDSSSSQWRNFSDGSLIDSLNDCEKEGFGTCCPENFDCVKGVCQISAAYLCADYTTQEECNNFNSIVAQTSVEKKREDSHTCPEVIGEIGGCAYSLENCSCFWDSLTSQCSAKADVSSSFCTNASIPLRIGLCSYTENLVEDSCENDGFLTYSWGANWTWDSNNTGRIDPLDESSDCVGGSRSIICPAKINLSFFNIFSLFLSVVLIILFYLFLKKRKNSSKKRKNSLKKRKKK